MSGFSTNPVPSPGRTNIDLGPYQATMNELLTLSISQREELYHHLLSWYDDIHAFLLGTIGDTPTTTQLSQQRPTPTTTYTVPSPRAPNSDGEISSDSSSSDGEIPPSPSITHPSPSPGTICTALIAALNATANSTTNPASTRAATIAALTPLSRFDLALPRDTAVVSVKAHLDMLSTHATWLDSGSTIVFATLSEQLASLCKSAEDAFGEGPTDPMAARALAIVSGLAANVRALATAIRPLAAWMDVAAEPAADGADGWWRRHPAALMVWRARIRGMRAYRGWKEEKRDRAFLRALRERIAAVSAVERLRAAMVVAIRAGVGERLSPYLNALLAHHTALVADRRICGMVVVAYWRRDLGVTGTGGELNKTFVACVATVRAQLGEVDGLVEPLRSWANKREFRKMVETHDLADARDILRSCWPDADDFNDGPTRSKAYHCFAVYYLSSKAVTLERHFDSDVPYVIKSLTKPASVQLARLFCWGAHYFRPARMLEHEPGCVLTALSWMCGLIPAWYSIHSDLTALLNMLKEKKTHNRIIEALRANQSAEDMDEDMQADMVPVRRIHVKLENLVHVTDVLIGLPPSRDGSLFEPAFKDQSGDKGDISVRRAYEEMRRMVVFPQDEGILQGGNLEISSERIRFWAI
ncbi:hypothetical protein SLS58_006427 [Diplodia intermedia]|uniref:Uncharacterized protein n=1 Tax=Diplodia intermedia TaxID=856260 RepID=A0ABR3TN47_9PEZI